MSIVLTAKRESSLLSTEFKREISLDQLELVKLLLLATDEASVDDFQRISLNLELSTLERRKGIDQYQAESR